MSNDATLQKAVVDAIRTCFDPEVPVNVYDLGLIYEIRADAGGAVGVRMTLTAPNCPAAQTLPADVERAIRAVPGVTDVRLELCFDPPWDPSKMSEAARLELGFM